MRLIATVCAFALLAAPTLAQDDFSGVKLSTQKLSDRVHVLFGRGGNIGIFLGDKRTLMIDDQFLPLGARIDKTINKLKTQPISFLINTHYHGDHSGGNAYFAQKGALIIAHDNVHKRLSTTQVSGFSGETIEPMEIIAQPVISYSTTQTIYEDGQTIKLIHVKSAHTDGDTFVYFMQDNVIHMGDVFFNGRWPYIDTSAGGSIDGMIAALSFGIELINEDTVVIPGHGPISDKAGVIAVRDRLADIAAKAGTVKAAGGSKTAFLASKPTADYPAIDEESGDGWTKRFLGIAFDSVSP